MKDADIIERIRTYVPLTHAEADRFFQFFEYRKLRKNELVVTQQKDPGIFLLIKSGCLMTYVQESSQQLHVLQLGAEMWWTGDLAAFTRGEISAYSIKALEASEVYQITGTAYHQLLEALPVMERYFRLIFQNALVAHQRRILMGLQATAQERYEAFQGQYPALAKGVPQKYIASYLGITPEFLSKIRANFRKD